MNFPTSKKIVLLGMMSRMPVAGCVWLTMHYLLGLRRLGYDAYYVEAHAITPATFVAHERDDGSGKAAAFIAGVMKRFDFEDHWAFHALHSDARCYGLSEIQLRDLYRDADLIINLHGATVPLPEQSESGRLIYLETDPVELEIELFHQQEAAFRFLEPHIRYFTWGTNYGSADCKVPLPERFPFVPTLPPVICDLWDNTMPEIRSTFTTVANWRQLNRKVTFQNEVYHWSKHFEFLKFLDLPLKSNRDFELALANYNAQDEQTLRKHGWNVRSAADISTDLDVYHEYLCTSRGEFTVAKDQNVRLKSGWFSDRSAQYLAAGRPVITQETGFSNSLPTGKGLFAFSTMDDVLAAVDTVNSDYEGNCRAAAEIAREYFNYDVVLTRLLDESGV
jgi:hypothetical protein